MNQIWSQLNNAYLPLSDWYEDAGGNYYRRLNDNNFICIQVNFNNKLQQKYVNDVKIIGNILKDFECRYKYGFSRYLPPLCWLSVEAVKQEVDLYIDKYNNCKI